MTDDKTAAPAADQDRGGEDDDISLDDVVGKAVAAAFEEDGDDGAGEAPAEAETEDAEAAEQEDDDEAQAEEPAGDDDDDKTEEADQEGGEQEEGEGEKAASEPLEAPEHWTADDRQTFSGLPPEAQAFILERDRAAAATLTRKVNEFTDQARFAEQVHGAFEPHQQQLAMAGLDEVGAVKYLLAMHRKYQEDPAGYLRMVAQHAGIDLARQGKPADGEDDEDLTDPAVSQLRGELGQIKSTLSDFQQQQLADRQRELESEVLAFQNEMGADGKPLRPHFERLAPDIKGYVALIKQQSPLKSNREVLSEAYERAVWGNEEIRKGLIAAQQQGAVAKVTESQTKAVERAKKVKTIKPKGGESRTVKTDLELGDAVTEAMRQHGAL